MSRDAAVSRWIQLTESRDAGHPCMVCLPDPDLMPSCGPQVTGDPAGAHPEHHAIVVPPISGGGSKRVHPLPYIENGLPGADLSLPLSSCVISTPSGANAAADPGYSIFA